MSISRKFRRGIENKRKKNIKKSFKSMTKRLDALGKQCINCAESFDRLDPQHMLEWMVYVTDDQPNLICPDCQAEIETAKKEAEEAEKTSEEDFVIHV